MNSEPTVPPSAAETPPRAPASPPIQVALADDHALMRRSLRLLLDSQPEIKVISEADNLASVARDGREASVLVLELTVPEGASVEAITRLRRRMPHTQVVVVTTSEDPVLAQGALAAGAIGIVLKQFADRDLPLAIRAAAANERYVSPSLANSLSSFRGSLAGQPLTPREVEVLRLIALGYTSIEIASRLGLSPRTIESHRARIHRALGLTTRAELVRYALAHGLLGT